MSLVRLLAVGKSLVGGRDMSSRYRMNKQEILPKFISPKKPFALSARQDAECGSVAAVQSGPRTVPTGPSGSVNLKKTQKLSIVAAQAKVGKKPRLARSVPSFAGRWGAWLREKNPLAFNAGDNPAPKATTASFTREPVQGELSLDKVTVMRNDLSDADLEVVPATPSDVRGNMGPILQITAKNKPTTTPWGRLTNRILGARAT
jgi:hypothetical protein